jgi:hypothetical protein
MAYYGTRNAFLKVKRAGTEQTAVVRVYRRFLLQSEAFSFPAEMLL